AGVIESFQGGNVVVGVCGAPFKCPPAPSEAALLLHDNLTERGLREQSEISFVMPFERPVPPSPETSEALLAAFAERGIKYLGGNVVASLDAQTVTLADGSELAYDLFLGVPRHRAPDVVAASGLLDGQPYIPVNPGTLQTRFEGVYALGDVAAVGVPK